MQLTLATIVAILPLLVLTTPVKPRGAIKISLTKRTSLTDNGVVKATALQSQLVQAQAKIARGFTNFKQNTGSTHPSDKGTLAKRATGADSLTDDGGDLWQGGISVGTPAVAFTVDFDTGSSDLFLPATACDVNCDGHTRYDTTASSTATDLGQTFSLAFGDGSTVQGEQFSDTVTVAGLTATSQAVGSATQYSTGFALAAFPPDGLLGLGFPQISGFGQTPVFQTLVAQGQTDEAVFGVTLATSGSELLLGGVDNSKFTGSLTQVPVTEVGFWQLNFDSVNVGTNQAVGSLSTIIDTGTTLVIGDTQNVAALYAAIPGSADASSTVGQGFFTVPCDAIPDISVTLGGTAFHISADTFNLGQVSAGSADCVGGIAAMDEGFWILGDVFLQNVYAAFDVGNTQVGFADLA